MRDRNPTQETYPDPLTSKKKRAFLIHKKSGVGAKQNQARKDRFKEFEIE